MNLKDKSMLYPAVEHSTLKELMAETIRQYSKNEQGGLLWKTNKEDSLEAALDS